MVLISIVKCRQGASELRGETVRFAFQKDHPVVWQGARPGGWGTVGKLFSNVGDKL